MSNIVPFDNNSALPAHLQKARRGKSKDLMQGVGAGLARMSIKGKTWAILKGEDRTIVMNPKDPDSPASFVGVVIVAASPDLSRTYYEKAFDDKAAAAQPDCSSANGKQPDAGVPSPQAKNCSVCPHAVYGTGPGGKGFRCSNHRRLVIAKPGEYSEEQIMMLNVPGGSLKNLREFATALDARQVDYDMVLTKLSFDPEEATPKIVFTPAGFLPEDHYNAVKELAEKPAVQQVLGASEATVQDTEDAPASAEQVADVPPLEQKPEVDEEAEAKKAAAAEKKAKAAAKKKAAAAKAKAAAEEAARLAAEAEAEDEDEEEATPVAAAAEPEPKEDKKSDALSDDLDDMLADFDD